MSIKIQKLQSVSDVFGEKASLNCQVSDSTWKVGEVQVQDVWYVFQKCGFFLKS